MPSPSLASARVKAEAAAIESDPSGFEAVFAYGVAAQEELGKNLGRMGRLQGKFHECLEDLAVATQVAAAEREALDMDEMERLSQDPAARAALKRAMGGVADALDALSGRLKAFSALREDMGELKKDALAARAELDEYLSEGRVLLSGYDKDIAAAQKDFEADSEDEDTLYTLRRRRETLQERVDALASSRGAADVGLRAIGDCDAMQKESAGKFGLLLFGAPDAQPGGAVFRLQALMKTIAREDVLEEIRHMNEGLRQDVAVLKPPRLKKAAPAP